MSTARDAVNRAIALNWSIFPCNLQKRPHGAALIASGRFRTEEEEGKEVKKAEWKTLQSTRPEPAEIQTWLKFRPASWAICTGAVSGVIIFDFDGEAGLETMRAWNIKPHVRTGSGGFHWYVTHPGHYIKTLNRKSAPELGKLFPGLDIRADGGYAIFHGENHSGSYEWLRPMEPDALALVPSTAREFFGLDTPTPEPPATQAAAPAPPPRPAPPTPSSSSSLPESSAEFVERQFQRAVARSASEGRNDSFFLFAGQAYDAGMDAAEIESTFAARYIQSVRSTNLKGQAEPLTLAELRASIRSVCNRPRREMARNPLKPTTRTAPAQASSNAPYSPPAPPSQGPGRPPSKRPHECLRTDLGNAERLILRFGRNLRYCHEMQSWFVWSGQRWQRDDNANVHRLAHETVRLIWTEAADLKDSDERKEVTTWALKSQSAGAISSMLKLAQAWLDVSIKADALDADPYLLNVENGTLNLRTGELRKHSREDLISKLAPVTYDPQAELPEWDRFIHQLMLGRKELVYFLQRALGYALTGAVESKALFVLFGKGDNGKTTMLEVFRSILGDYAGVIDINTLMAARHQNASAPSPEIANLRGARFVTTSEADEDQRLNEAKVKHLTGMGRITARFLHKDPIEFDPTHKLFLDANYRPTVKGQDKGIWTRLKLIPFDLKLTEAEKDMRLMDKLKAEAPGILLWALSGCLAWQERGLGEPEEVKAATAEYRFAMDSLGRFVSDICKTDDPAYEESARELYLCYRRWAEGAGEPPMSERSFSERLSDRGFTKHRRATGVWWLGIRMDAKVTESGRILSGDSREVAA